ncbi:cephalosporin hydroxylase [Moorena producens 3L]|uniref:Cephalosporin hydroxylase n=1 Tax=Moorena producens 3L TaxID=489825 RepID=F4XQB0_9CYAN|nr:cephalosporin hydroxylase family protein [Moorena producens]EGJ33224.1 cephalosporin hydroxylase [Moorena producens 3L]OLT53574.1 cephalosporin hydroxylase [Moorena producens 3L]
MSNPINDFKEERQRLVKEMGNSPDLKDLGLNFLIETAPHKYAYHFSWMGRPIIQFPQDMVAMQEIIWDVKPDLIIETGIAHGGSLVFYASMLQLIGKGKVVGIDIDIRSHNKEQIEQHPMYHRIQMIEGSSISQSVIDEVKSIAADKENVLVVLDSNHTHEHVLEELRAYAPLTTRNSYCVVFDTVVEHMPENSFPDRPWGKGDNPKTAVEEFMKENNDFEVNHMVDNKLLISVAPGGYLKRVK